MEEDKCIWFERLFARVRQMDVYISRDEIVEKLISEGYSIENIFLVLKAVDVMDVP